MEQLAEAGNVTEASELMQAVDMLKAEQARLQDSLTQVDPAFRHEQRMEICDVCGAFSVPIDGHVRQVSHVEGKQHTGFVKLRQVLQELKVRGSARSWAASV